MAFIEKVNELIQGFPEIDSLGHYNRLPAGSFNIGEYAIFQTGDRHVMMYMHNASIWRYDFVIQARLDSATDAARLESTSFGERLSRYLHSKNRKGIDLGPDRDFIEIRSEPGFYTPDEDDQHGIYQIQCSILYERDDDFAG